MDVWLALHTAFTGDTSYGKDSLAFDLGLPLRRLVARHTHGMAHSAGQVAPPAVQTHKSAIANLHDPERSQKDSQTATPAAIILGL